MIRWQFLLVFSSASLTGLSSGCASALRPFVELGPTAHRYQPLTAPAATSVDARWRALEGIARAEGWKLEYSDPQRGEMIAVLGGDAEFREHLRITVGEQATVVEAATQMREDDGWEASPFICEGYSYAREKLIVQRIDRSPEPQRLVALAR